MTDEIFEIEQGEPLTDEVRFELDSPTDVSVVLAYRRDGELFELAERSAPAVVAIRGTPQTDADDPLS